MKPNLNGLADSLRLMRSTATQHVTARELSTKWLFLSLADKRRLRARLPGVSQARLPGVSQARLPAELINLFKPVIFLLLMLIFSVSISAAGTKDPEISDIIITTSNSHLLLFATVKNCFTPEMIKGAHNGITISFNFEVELEKIRNNWFDATLVQQTITHTLTFDSLKEKYHVKLSEKNNKTETTRSLEKAKQLMSELNGITLIERKTLIPDAPYACHIKATMEKNTLPLGMHYILPFTSLWDFETDWRTIEFRY
ncbi:MAG: DUF4390 domain-containing protein [Desulfobulbaceae bacterium]|nr:DUF4390 domain-containing protein [Desulfobulbaceae bacterium]